MMYKSAAKQKNSDLKFVLYVTPKAPKEAVISTSAPSSSSTSTFVPTNLDLEIVQDVFDKSTLLDPDKYLKDNDMEEDLKDFTVVTKATPFVVANATATALHVTIPDLKIDTFCDFSQYKADMQFNEKTINVIDIPLQMKPANIKQVFAKYETVTEFKITIRGMWQHAYITYENPKCIELFHQM
ncbi:13083_t:CDS:2 [Funneliformis geosporum]|uniref:13083_t:CDS:1 n=1 Tax=Funneliformis geosporum TaxID=1117311 RepID=A0A9W4SIH2_9GLOM|nr:13083_t:CDS:2 [Funneliformis geosporum]